MAHPTIVIVPGSFAAHGAYQPIVDQLRTKGYPALEVFLPSTQKRIGLEPATMDEDAKKIRAVVEALIAQNKEVVVVCHSYGGVPTTQALAGIQVKRIVYLTAIAPKVGESQADAMAGPVIDAILASAVNGYLHSDPAQLAFAIGNDFESWESAYECVQLLPHHSAASFTNPVTGAGYEKNPVSYIFTEIDLVVSPELQEKFIKNIEEVKGEKIDVIRKPWGHCPNWSKPEELIEVLIGEAEK